MLIASEVRAEASRRADFMVPEILRLAIQYLNGNRWALLRKGQTHPANPQEAAYKHALGMYVYNKLQLRRMHIYWSESGHDNRFARHSIDWSKRNFYEAERDKYRNEMDRIEHGLGGELQKVFVALSESNERYAG